MTYNEITQILKSMVIIVDDREKDTPLLHQRLSSFPCAYMRKRLDFGDYSAEVTLPNGEKFSLADKVTIERKNSIDEICGNFTTNRIRFAKESTGRLQPEQKLTYSLKTVHGKRSIAVHIAVR